MIKGVIVGVFTKESAAHALWRANNRDRCRRWRLDSQKRTGSSKVYRSNHPEIVTESYKRRRDKVKKVIREAKNTPCVDCHHQLESWQMHFDHVRGVKLFSLGGPEAHNYTLEEILAEIAKCDVRCFRCHRKRHEIAKHESSKGQMEH